MGGGKKRGKSIITQKGEQKEEKEKRNEKKRQEGEQKEEKEKIEKKETNRKQKISHGSLRTEVRKKNIKWREKQYKN